jgi:general secretion pathway protein C
VGTEAQDSLGAVFDTATNRVRSVRAGDSVEGRRVLRVERQRVVLERGEIVPHQTKPPPPAKAKAQESGLRPLSAHSFELARSQLDAWMARPEQLATDAYLAPFIRNGVAIGFRLTRVRPGSVYASLGVQSGDVIRRVNGINTDRPANLLEILEGLKTWSKVEVQLERDGQVIRKDFEIR